jgi:hypothetical protein
MTQAVQEEEDEESTYPSEEEEESVPSSWEEQTTSMSSSSFSSMEQEEEEEEQSPEMKRLPTSAHGNNNQDPFFVDGGDGASTSSAPQKRRKKRAPNRETGADPGEDPVQEEEQPQEQPDEENGQAVVVVPEEEPSPPPSSRRRRVPVEEPEEEEDANSEEERHRRQRITYFILALFCCLLVLIALILVFLLLRNRDDDMDETATEVPRSFNPDMGSDTDDDFFFADPIVVALGLTTSVMARYDFNCEYGDQAGFPDVWDQCRCDGAITIVPEDVLPVRSLLIEELLIPIVYGNETGYEVPSIESCDPSNMALIWLASGDSRDAGYLRQRYVLAHLFYLMDGPEWDYENGWLTPLNECLWLGTQCSNWDVINSLALDTNNLYGTVRYTRFLLLLRSFSSIRGL